jgi:D-alanyl-D-alanine carboxypeptidase/D-alanyl-D-alanine-endopeptidase (penicillin-binding protein 4)
VAIYDGVGSDPSSATSAAMVQWLTWLRSRPFGAQLRQGLPDVSHDGTILAKSGLSARPEIGPQPALFVAAGQAGYITTKKGKDLAVALYALNARYPSVADGLTKDLPATEQVMREIQQAN